MTKTNFAELKEKLTEWTEQSMNEIFDLCSNDCSNNNSEMPCAVTGAQYQHAKSAAIISELIEIISFQDNKISELLNYLHHNEDNLVGDDLIGDQRFTKRFNNYTKSTSDVLSETTTRLQKLRDGK